ncbi:hsp90 co-chaperone Cdc37-like isoform X2 [Dendronephthya gigantea]|uniref:hsp90 co-chaperone Cdc37-like isoform X2 n=1 Tax=Dendronephthya gigantea TaxID=151771 RepID=UPI00106C58E6|nr:hsp90 co-chaperone Cdc37-like isoform X2 [Dendronephthya gigantea]
MQNGLYQSGRETCLKICLNMVDYSKWDHIEVSDDEDETHPNIDTPSLFRWRHQARVEKMDELKKERETVDSEAKMYENRLQEVQEKLKGAQLSEKTKDIEKYKEDLKQIQQQEDHFRKKELELAKKEKLQPWNVDTLSKDGFSKTIINKPKSKQEEKLTEEEKWKRSQQFMDKYEKEIKKFGMLHEYHDSKDYLLQNIQLVGEDTANYLTLWCVNLEVEEKHDLMKRVAHQTIIMQYLLELSKTLEASPPQTVSLFFTRMAKAKTDFTDYIQAFEDELASFIERVEGRAKARIEKAQAEAEEEERLEREKRLGPGGLDPVEVFESLPETVQECFEKKDIPMLQKVLGELPEEEARYHLKRCVDSGLWIPNAKDAKPDLQPQEPEEKYDEPDEP